MTSQNWPILGCGVGLRNVHYGTITTEWPKMDWFEAITENFMDSGGRPVHILGKVREKYPLALHGVSLSIGSVDPLNRQYLERLKLLAKRMEPSIISDHLCWCGVDGEELHDLLPLPFTEESLAHIAERVSEVQEFLNRKILLENVSSYVTYKHSVIPEWEFLSEVARRSGCGILLDINNIYVNSANHQFDSIEYINSIPRESVGQFHLAGHTDMGSYLFDTHSAPVIRPVWELYQHALRRFGPVSTLIEWDEQIPEYKELSDEAERARTIYNQMTGGRESFAPADINPKKEPQLARKHEALPLVQIERLMKSHIHPIEKIPPDSSLQDSLNPQGGEEGIKRLSVYATGYTARTHDGLSETYETIQNILGPDEFDHLTRAYMNRFPSHDYNLSLIGQHLPEFLKAHSLVQKFPFLPDLARLEWFVSQTFHAFDQAAFNPKTLSELPMEDWESATFTFQPSVKLMKSSWPVWDLWKSKKNLTPSSNFHLPKQTEFILIYRRNFQVCAEMMGDVQYGLLNQLMEGSSLGRACETLADQNEADKLPISQWFSDWTRLGLIADCSFSKLSAKKP